MYVYVCVQCVSVSERERACVYGMCVFLFVLILSPFLQLVPLVVALCHICAPIEWVWSNRDFKSLYMEHTQREGLGDVGNPVLRSFMSNPGLAGTGFFFTDPTRAYYRGQDCPYVSVADAEGHLRVGHMCVHSWPLTRSAISEYCIAVVVVFFH